MANRATISQERPSLKRKRGHTLTSRPRLQFAVSQFIRDNGLGYQFNLALQACTRAFLDNDDMLLAQFANWLGGGSESLTVDPNDLSPSPNSPRTRASRSKLKPLGLGDADQLIRLFALLVNEAGYSGLYFAIDEIELIAGQTSRRRNNSFQTLRALVDQNDENLMPPSTCLYLAATPDMFESPDLFPSYKALQDRIEELPSLTGGFAHRLHFATTNVPLPISHKNGSSGSWSPTSRC